MTPFLTANFDQTDDLVSGEKCFTKQISQQSDEILIHTFIQSISNVQSPITMYIKSFSKFQRFMDRQQFY